MDPKPHSDAQLQLWRSQMVAYINKVGYKPLLKSGQRLEDIITCEKCDARTHCRSSYDIYNVDGDCLEDK